MALIEEVVSVEDNNSLSESSKISLFENDKSETSNNSAQGEVKKAPKKKNVKKRSKSNNKKNQPVVDTKKSIDEKGEKKISKSESHKPTLQQRKKAAKRKKTEALYFSEKKDDVVLDAEKNSAPSDPVVELETNEQVLRSGLETAEVNPEHNSGHESTLTDPQEKKEEKFLLENDFSSKRK